MGEEIGEDVLVDRRILHRRIGEDQRVRVLLLRGIGRGIGEQVAIGVAIAGIERSAIGAILRLRRAGEPDTESKQAKGRDLGAQHGNLPGSGALDQRSCKISSILIKSYQGDKSGRLIRWGFA